MPSWSCGAVQCEGTVTSVSHLAVSPGGFDGEGGLDEEEIEGLREGVCFEEFAAAAGDGGFSAQEEGDIGAELRGEGGESLVVERGGCLGVECFEDGGGIATAAAEAGAVGDVFVQFDFRSAGVAGLAKK